MDAAAEVLVQDAEREQQREAGRRRRGQQQQRQAGRAHEGDGGDMGCEGRVDGKYIGEMQHDRAWPARHENPALPLRERESGYDCARAF